MHAPPLFFRRQCGQVRIGIGARKKQIEEIDRGKRNKTESHVIADPVPVDQGRLPDQSDLVKEENCKITDGAAPEDDFTDPFEGNVLDGHHQDKQLQKGDARSGHFLDHHQITEKDRGDRNRAGCQMHIREHDPHKEKKQAEIPDQLAQFRSEKRAEPAVVDISLQHP